MKRIVVIALTLFFIISYLDAKEKIPKEHIVKVLTTDHTEHIGTLLAINNTLLVIWSCLDPFNENEVKKFLQVFHYSNIKRITLVRKSSFASGAKIGAIVTGFIGAYNLWRTNKEVTEEEGEGIIERPLFDFVLPVMWISLPGFFVGGIAGELYGINFRYKIDGLEYPFFKTAKKLRKKALFKENIPDKLQQIIDSSLP